MRESPRCGEYARACHRGGGLGVEGLTYTICRADVVATTKLRDARRARPVAGRLDDGARTLRAGGRSRDGAAGAEPRVGRRRSHGGTVCRVRQRLVRAGARVRRHPQRVDRPHEQPVGGGGARARRDAPHQRPRPDRRHRRRQRRSPAASGRWLRARSTAAAFIPPGSSRRSASPTRPGSCWVSTRRRWPGPPASPAAPRPVCSSAGWTARSRSSSTRGSRRRTASPRRCWRRPGPRGPPKVFEGRFGLFASHLQDPAIVRRTWRASPTVSARGGTAATRRSSRFRRRTCCTRTSISVLRLRAQHGIRPTDVVSIECPVAEFNVSIVCEPVAEKTAPATEAHGRVCLQYTLAEALVRGELGRTAYWRSLPDGSGDPGAGPACDLPRGPRLSAARALQGRAHDDARRRPGVFTRSRNTTAARPRTR